MKKCRELLLLISIIFLSAGCPNPIQEEYLLKAKDQSPPVITINTPEEGSAYAATIVVEGLVTDDAGTEETEGGISSLLYEVLSTSLEGPVEVTEEGGFSFSFPADSLSGSVTIVLTAEDWNGNTTEASLTLVDGGSGIPSFQALPGNKKAVFTWDNVALAEKYILHELVSGNSFSSITSPYTLTGLNNGYQYTFMLESVSSSGENNFSGEKSCIPLSETTLIPGVKGEYNGIRLAWDTIPGTDRYQVFRSRSKSGPFYQISGALSSPAYFDAQAEQGEKYYYSVSPFDQQDIISAPAHGTRAYFPRENQRLSFPVNIPGGSSANDVTAQGNYLYTAEKTKNKVGIFEISRPDKPVYSGYLSMPNSTEGIFSDDDYLYVCGYKFFRIYSLSGTPASPEQVYSYTFTDDIQCKDVTASNGYAYIAANTYGLWKFDIRSLSSVPGPEWSFIAGNALALGITTDGSYIYLATSLSGQEFMIYDPDTLGQTGYADLPDNPAFDVAVSGNSAFIADYEGGICYVDITSKTGDRTETVKSLNFLAPNNSQGIALRGRYAFVAEGLNGGPGNGLHIIDISNPDSMTLVKSYHSNGYAAAVSLSGAYAYIADSDEGIQTVNIAEPGEPVLESFMSATPAGTGVAVDGDTAFLAAGSSGIKVYDVTDPGNPLWLKNLDTPNSATKGTIQGNYGYIADNMAGLQIIDISTPSKAFLAGSFPTDDGSNAANVCVRGDTAFLINYNSPYLRILDISSPGQPDFLGGLSLSDIPKGISYSDGLLYCTDNDLRIIDASVPGSPFILGTSPLPAASYGLAVQEDYAFVADNAGGLRILNISDPENVIEEGSYVPASSSAWAVDIQGDYAFLGNGTNNKLIILYVSDPLAVRVVAEYAVGSTVYDCRVTGEYCYIASAGGMTILDLWPWND